MSTAPAQATTDTMPVREMVKSAEQTTSWDQVLLLRVRDRLAAHGLQLELHAEKAGWAWAVSGQVHAKRAFGSLHLALKHADTYTSVWYREPPLGNGHLNPDPG